MALVDDQVRIASRTTVMETDQPAPRRDLHVEDRAAGGVEGETTLEWRLEGRGMPVVVAIDVVRIAGASQ
jgi:hypothetical protein